MSAVGATDWYNESITLEINDQDLVLWQNPLVFVEEVREKLGVCFFGTRLPVRNHDSLIALLSNTPEALYRIFLMITRLTEPAIGGTLRSRTTL